MNFVGVDIGGSKIFSARADKNGNFEEEFTIRTEAEKGTKQVIENLLTAIKKVSNEQTVAVGMAWAGFIDSAKGVISKSPNIQGFENYPIIKELTKELNLPIFIENDARLFALGEAMSHAHQKEFLLGIILGTGVGGGIVINGKVFRGFDGFAGEIGHTFVDLEGKIEAEDVFSAGAIKKLMTNNNLPEKIEESAPAWQKRQGKEYEIIENWLNQLAFWVSNLILAYNPEKVVFGGGIGTNVMPIFIENLEEKVKKILNKRQFFPHVKLASSKLKNAGAVGAIYLAQQEFNQ